MSLSIDHIEVTDHTIELFYWERSLELKSIIFRTEEFELWRQSSGPVDWNSYWTNWQPHKEEEPGHLTIAKDIERFAMQKLQGMIVGPLSAPPQIDIKPMRRVGEEPGATNSKKLG